MYRLISHGSLYENGDSVTVTCIVCGCKYEHSIRELDKIVIGMPAKRIIIRSYSECPECTYKNPLKLLDKEPKSND